MLHSAMGTPCRPKSEDTQALQKQVLFQCSGEKPLDWSFILRRDDLGKKGMATKELSSTPRHHIEDLFPT